MLKTKIDLSCPYVYKIFFFQIPKTLDIELMKGSETLLNTIVENEKKTVIFSMHTLFSVCKTITGK